MAVVYIGVGSTVGNPALDIYFQDTKSALVNVATLEFQIWDCHTDALMTSPTPVYPSSSDKNAWQSINVSGSDHLGTGHYVAEWTPDSSYSTKTGDYEIRWRYKSTSSSFYTYYREIFQVFTPTVTEVGTVNAVIAQTNTVAGSVNAVIAQTNAVAGSVDAVVAQTNTAAGSTDAVVAQTNTATGSVNGSVSLEVDLTGSVDAVIAEPLDEVGQIDAVIAQTNTAASSADAVVAQTNTATGSADAVVAQTNAITGVVNSSIVDTRYLFGAVNAYVQPALYGALNAVVLEFGTCDVSVVGDTSVALELIDVGTDAILSGLDGTVTIEVADTAVVLTEEEL